VIGVRRETTSLYRASVGGGEKQSWAGWGKQWGVAWGKNGDAYKKVVESKTHGKKKKRGYGST